MDLHRVIKMNGACPLTQALEHGPQPILRRQSPFKTSVKFKLYHFPIASWLEVFIHSMYSSLELSHFYIPAPGSKWMYNPRLCHDPQRASSFRRCTQCYVPLVEDFQTAVFPVPRTVLTQNWC